MADLQTTRHSERLSMLCKMFHHRTLRCARLSVYNHVENAPKKQLVTDTCAIQQMWVMMWYLMSNRWRGDGCFLGKWIKTLRIPDTNELSLVNLPYNQSWMPNYRWVGYVQRSLDHQESLIRSSMVYSILVPVYARNASLGLRFPQPKCSSGSAPPRWCAQYDSKTNKPTTIIR